MVANISGHPGLISQWPVPACTFRPRFPDEAGRVSSTTTAAKSLEATAVTILSEAKVGSAGVVEQIDLPEEVSNYLAHLGFLPGTAVEVLRRAPAADPTSLPASTALRWACATRLRGTFICA